MGNTKLFIGVLLAALGVVLAYCVSFGREAQAELADGRLLFEEREIHLGEFETEGIITGQFAFQNPGPGSAYVDGIALSCGCSTVRFVVGTVEYTYAKGQTAKARGLFARSPGGSDVDSFEVEAGAQGTLIVSVDMADIMGRRNISLRMRYANSGDFETLKWSVIGLPSFETTPSNLHLGRVVAGDTGALSFRVRNTRPVTWRFAGVESLVEEVVGTLVPGDDGWARIDLRVQPRELGRQSVPLWITTTDPKVRFHVVAKIDVESPVRLSPSALMNFGQIPVNTGADCRLVITARDGGALSVARIEQVGRSFGVLPEAVIENERGSVVVVLRVPESPTAGEVITGAYRMELRPERYGHIEFAYSGVVR